jgi:hypothetical protein
VLNPYAWANETYKPHLIARIQRFGLSKQTKRTEEGFTHAKTCAYLLLSSVDNVLVENPDLLPILQRLPQNQEPSVLEYLLAIGVYSDKDSPIAPLAFRLVRWIAHGYEGFRYKFLADKYDDPEEPPSPPKGCFGDPVYDRLVTAYAEDFLFSYPLTSQMAAGFEIFWNHRYKGLEPNTICDIRVHKYEKVELDIRGLDNNTVIKQWTWERPHYHGHTPLEVYAHFLFYDPAPSDFFTQSILKVINFYHSYTARFRNHEGKEFGTDEEYAEFQETLFKHDIVFFDVLRTPFKNNRGQVVTMTDLVNLLLFPCQHLGELPKGLKIRTAVNGAPMEFGRLWKGSDFFTDSDGPTAMCAHPAVQLLGEVSRELQERQTLYRKRN